LEDDEILGESLKDLLEGEGFEVEWVKESQRALDVTFLKRFSLWIFDVKVPGMDGFELLKSLRAAGDRTPAIFVTALTDIDSIAKGFESGAEEYIKKPFDFDELLIRIKALLKRSYLSGADEIEFADLKFDPLAEKLYKNGEPLHLPPLQMRLLKLFMKNCCKVLSKEEIIWEISGGEEISPDALRVHINRLRKIGLPIKNIRKVGYILERADE